ncbi:hypothetical protein JTE90_007027 [Oedothorax gibbosus]|uniref:Uncharacterized protein n=1 Tax=Oedothorax gibbosus TaxID=931172 RepID=A0AAV6U892_9ARAC|nr:hypothetical protein JTE90_007027 [Oedothorax gibbosus]
MPIPYNIRGMWFCSPCQEKGAGQECVVNGAGESVLLPLGRLFDIFKSSGRAIDSGSKVADFGAPEISPGSNGDLSPKRRKIAGETGKRKAYSRGTHFKIKIRRREITEALTRRVTLEPGHSDIYEKK